MFSFFKISIYLSYKMIDFTDLFCLFVLRYSHEVKPGEIVEISRHGVRTLDTIPRSEGDPVAFCIFEYVYFARPDSIFEGKYISFLWLFVWISFISLKHDSSWPRACVTLGKHVAEWKLWICPWAANHNCSSFQLLDSDFSFLFFCNKGYNFQIHFKVIFVQLNLLVYVFLLYCFYIFCSMYKILHQLFRNQYCSQLRHSDSLPNIPGQMVYTVRYRCGQQLAIEAPVEADLVSTVPESATPAALGYAAKVLTLNYYSVRWSSDS